MRIWILSFVLLSTQALAAVQQHTFHDKTIYDMSLDGLALEQQVIEGVRFDAVAALGAANLAAVDYEIGAPEIPVLRLQVTARSAAEIVVTERHLKKAQALSVKAMKPVLESAAKIRGARTELVALKSAKSHDAWNVQELGSIRGERQFLVTLRPVEYVAGAALVTRSFSVEVPAQSVQKDDANSGILFVVGEQFKNSAALTRYIELRRSAGLTPSRLDVTAQTSADEIRAHIQDLYRRDKALKFVVVVGDDDDVTARDSQNISGLTDHYYAAIDTADYESDIQTPDLYVGRISAANVEELETILTKYTRYIRGEFARMDWVSQASFLATDDRYTVAEGTHNYVIDTHTQARGYSGSFPATRQGGGDKLYAITHRAGNREVMAALSSGRSIVDYSGHGATTYWDAPQVDQADVRSLSHSSLPFVMSNACITGDFRVDESFAETWQRHEWGAVMFWGSMDSTYWDEDDILERRLFDGLFQLGKKHFGEITHHALAEMTRFYGGAGRSSYYWETYHMFGDPSVNLRLH